MAFRVFSISVHGDLVSEEELNRFLLAHRVLHVDRKLIESPPNPVWSFCVEYQLASASPTPARTAAARDKLRNRVDYQELLSPAEYRLYSALRDWRKMVSERDRVPVWAVFTNEQLAQIAQRRIDNSTALHQIVGVGDARVEKYAADVLAIVESLPTENPSPPAASPTPP